MDLYEGAESEILYNTKFCWNPDLCTAYLGKENMCRLYKGRRKAYNNRASLYNNNNIIW